jgi:rhomboid family GlyGly-CTERM serine protease
MYGTQTQSTLTSWMVAALAAAAATCLPERLSLDVDKVLQGEWWRLASGHVVHLNWRHYGCDLVALGLALCLCSRLEARFRDVVVTALLSATVVSATMMVVRPVDVYGGVSGITTGLLSFAALRLTARDAGIGGALLLAGMLLKVCLERQGVSASAVAPVWQAHCAGAVAGAIVAAISLKLNCQAYPDSQLEGRHEQRDIC